MAGRESADREIVVAAVRIYSTHHCGYCTAAVRLLEKKGASIETIYVDDRPGQRAAMIELTGRSSVPQIFIGDRYVGGYRDLAELEISDRLDALLQGA